jgi:hypothetical protein
VSIGHSSKVRFSRNEDADVCDIAIVAVALARDENCMHVTVVT